MSWQKDRTDEQLLFNELFLKITYCASQHMIILRWTTYAASAEYRRGLEFAPDFVRSSRVTYGPADLRQMSAILLYD